ncbi:proclotting enzyme-like [Scylla paramamosain]|uniref:proclotting enzyme-like n=1 Tax=Scylla paramamosain TaxID=85552 RepID=UPI003082958A
MDVRVCCLLLFVAASSVPSLASDFVIQPIKGELPALHKRGQNARRPGHEGTSIEPKQHPVDREHEGASIMPKQGGNQAVHKQLDPVDCQEGEIVTVGEEGRRITSPGYPDNYPDRERCKLKIVAENSECTLMIDCDDFHIQESRNCRRDFLQIKEKRRKKKFCGDTGFEYESKRNILTLQFRSDRSGTDKGFSCLARSVCPSTMTTTTTAETTTTASSTGSCECGIANPSRIVGGVEVSPANKYPWHAGIKKKDDEKYRCGGSIITNKHIMTAAHCVKDVPAKELVVGVADHNMQSTNDDEPGVTRLVGVQDITVHPDYNPRTLDSDIALITLSETLDLTQHKELRPVCLPADDSKTYAGMMATATGWGTLQSGGERPDILNEVSVPILEPSCPEMDITENMLCAGLEEGGKDTCQGDSGGPLFVFNNSTSKYEQVGITSWGYGCADPNQPGVYTRTSKFLTWIHDNTVDATYCRE